MTVIEQELPSQVRTLLDEHLDGLERVLLTAGVSRPQRQAICEDVELQVREMLWARSQATPTVEQVRAVLAELDPPEAYLEAVGSGTPVLVHAGGDTQQRTHILAVIAALVPVFGVMLLFSPLGRGGEERALVFLICAEVVAIVFATIAIREIRRSPEHWSGIGLAVFGLLALPLLVGNFFAYMALAPTYYNSLVGPAKRAYLLKEQRASTIASLNREIENMKNGPGMMGEEETPLKARTRERIAETQKEIQRLERASATKSLTSTEQWLFEHRTMVEFVIYSVVMGLSGLASILIYLVAHRRCLPHATIKSPVH
jgi:hypothetical protein